MKQYSTRPKSEKGAPAAAPNPAAGARAPAIDPRWRWHYGVLVRLRDDLLRARGEMLQAAAEGPIEPHSMHPADSATDEFDHDLSLTLLSAEQNGLNEVNDAILRICSGHYGICEETGRPIPKERLKAVPWARYTAEVETRLEKAGERPTPHLASASSFRDPRAGPPEDEPITDETEEEPPEPRVPQFLEFALEKEREEDLVHAVRGPVAHRPKPAPVLHDTHKRAK